MQENSRNAGYSCKQEERARSPPHSDLISQKIQIGGRNKWLIRLIFVAGSLTGTMITDIWCLADRITLRLPVIRTKITAFGYLKLYIVTAFAHFYTVFFITEKTHGTFLKKGASKRLSWIFLTRLEGTVFFYFLSNGTWVFV